VGFSKAGLEIISGLGGFSHHDGTSAEFFVENSRTWFQVSGKGACSPI
jgi:hypothetical protein